ncbi:MAG: hypothetical protein J6O55_02290 [Lachnospiraceae bacterium]|nr:hypothetical protein [Lachnospiraceae bacterium]
MGRDRAEDNIKEREKFVDAAYSKGWGASKADLRAIYEFCSLSNLDSYLNDELATGTNINYHEWHVSEDSPLVRLQRHEFFSRLKEEVEEKEVRINNYKEERKHNALKVINRLIEENAAEAEKEKPEHERLLDEYEKSVNEKLSPLNIREFSDQDFNKLLDVRVNFSWGSGETGIAFKNALTDVYLQRFTIKAARDDYDKKCSLPMKELLLKLHETAGAFLDGANALKGLPNDVKAAAGVINPDALKRYEARAEKEKQEAEEKEKNEYKNFFRMQGRLLTKMEASLGREYKDIYDSLSGKNRDLKADYLAEKINLREKSVAFDHALTEMHNTHEKSMKKRLMKTLGIDKEDLTLKRLFEKMGLSEERQREELALLKDKGNFSLESMARDLYQDEGQLDSNIEKLNEELVRANPEAVANAQNAPRNGGNRIGLEGLGNRVNNGHNANNNNVNYHALRNQNRESAANNMQLNVINNENEPIIKVGRGMKIERS